VVRHSASLTPSEVQKQEHAPYAKLGMTGVMVQAFNIIQDRIARARLAGDPPDISLQPRLSDIGLSEFHRAGEAIERGYQEATARLPELKRMQELFAGSS
jgi:NTE family protein